ncbi:hypothetical protein KKD19_01520 [Patescibacteria group bacterium]|nr:hypothetical protein [Patescibacteria group bacterium]MBU4511911.1 hypothetical protein [Patescibacteria group bacterium]MCG2692879.1 hypothetical protein [Candidatus Parcubacteria bacterium]
MNSSFALRPVPHFPDPHRQTSGDYASRRLRGEWNDLLLATTPSCRGCIQQQELKVLFLYYLFYKILSIVALVKSMSFVGGVRPPTATDFVNH